jgi:anti-sigma B factor antagonist
MHTSTHGSFTVLAVDGEIDIQTAPELRSQLVKLIDAGTRALVVDLTKVDFLDSSALGALVGAGKHAEREGGSLSVVCSSPKIIRIFQITRLTEVIPVYGDLDLACR